jgi:hypothetical protein
MRDRLSPYEVQECYRRAVEARRMADVAATSAERADLLEVERGWLSLARSYGSQEEYVPPRPRGHRRPVLLIGVVAALVL